MRFDVVTLFPRLFDSFCATGVLGRAIERGRVELQTHDLRSWAGNRWGQVDDEPYGGGAGMVLQAPPVLAAVREVAGLAGGPSSVVLLTPRGRVLDQGLVEELSGRGRLILVCGRYEGFDERVLDLLRPEEVSIGDFVLGGGEVAAMVLIEAVSRLVPGVVGDPESVEADSFAGGLLDHPCYTRPAEVEGLEVPSILRSGDHGAVRRWRLEQAVGLTVTRRPDLIKKHWGRLDEDARALVRSLAPELAGE